MNQSKPVIQFDKDGRPVATFSSIREAARVTGVKRSTIYDSCSGRSKKGKGFHWVTMAVDTGEEQRHRLIHASLFSGIGGPEVAAAMLGWENAFHCEINPFGKTVLDYWFPKSISYEDITKTDFHEWRGKIDVLTGGFPCQPFSYAGKRAGREDNRYLWPQMLRAIDEIRPTWVVGENVAGLATMVEGGICTQLGSSSTLFGEGDDLYQYGLEQTFTIERICRDLERLGYSVQPVLIPAAAVGAPHRRDRIFILAFDADTYGRNDEGGSGADAGTGTGEGIQERHEVRQPGVATELRPEVQGTAENPSRDGCRLRADEKQGSDWNERHACTGNHERICGEKGVDSADPDGGRGREVSPKVYPGVADGNEPLGNGGQRDAADSYGAGREESLVPGRQADPAEAGAGIYDRTERPCSDGFSSDPKCKGLERQDEPRSEEGGQRLHIRGDFAGHDRQDLFPENRWSVFPTVSPVHRGNDGLPFSLDDLTISPAKWRTESLKAYGNAIVPQVMYRIFQAIESTY